MSRPGWRRGAPGRALWLVGLLLLPALGLGAEALGAPAGGDSPPGREDTAREWFSNLPMVTHEGREVRFYDDLLQGKVVLLSGFYVDCVTISPRQNTTLSQLQNLLGAQLGKEVFIVSITVDPANDTLERVAEYAQVWKARTGWDLVTGKAENVDWVNYKLGQYVEDPETQHKGLYLLGNMRTGLWMKVPPQAGPDVLLARVRQALADDGKALP